MENGAEMSCRISTKAKFCVTYDCQLFQGQGLFDKRAPSTTWSHLHQHEQSEVVQTHRAVRPALLNRSIGLKTLIFSDSKSCRVSARFVRAVVKAPSVTPESQTGNHAIWNSLLVPGNWSKIRFHLLASICTACLQNIRWSCWQMRFHLIVNKVEMPGLSRVEMTLVLLQACCIGSSSWCYWLLIRSVYTFPFSLDFCPPWLTSYSKWGPCHSTLLQPGRDILRWASRGWSVLFLPPFALWTFCDHTN